MAKGDSSGRTEAVLGWLQRSGARRGVFGQSRAWFWVFVGSWLLRRGRRAMGRTPVVVYREELAPGQGFRIDHLAETYDGRPLGHRRSLRRRRSTSPG